MVKTITQDEWELIAKVKQDKRVRGELEYQTLIKSQFVFEYEYQNVSWFDINPILDEGSNLIERPNPKKEKQIIPELENFIDSTIVKALNEFSHQYEEYLSNRNYYQAANLADKIYEMCNDIIVGLDPEKQRDIYTKVVALSSYWKLSRDLYRGITVSFTSRPSGG